MPKKVIPQAKYWMLTIPHAHFLPFKPPGVAYVRGQLELGRKAIDEQSVTVEDQVTRCPQVVECSSSIESVSTPMASDDGTSIGYLHWQIVVIFERKIRLGGVREIFGPWHAEPVRSDSDALEYVWKSDTAVLGTRFELGRRPVRQNVAADWDVIRSDAKAGRLDDIAPNIYVLHYGNLRRIAQDNLQPIVQVRQVVVYWGLTGVGKSRRAWNEAGLQAYPKDPRSKFWDGYRGQDNVVIDEFRGDIDIGHVLRWFDRYPCIVEVKGSSVVLSAKYIWITSNVPPENWYPTLDLATKDALMRRLVVVEMTEQNTNLLQLICEAPETITSIVDQSDP